MCHENGLHWVTLNLVQKKLHHSFMMKQYTEFCAYVYKIAIESAVSIPFYEHNLFGSNKNILSYTNGLLLTIVLHVLWLQIIICKL